MVQAKYRQRARAGAQGENIQARRGSYPAGFVLGGKIGRRKRKICPLKFGFSQAERQP